MALHQLPAVSETVHGPFNRDREPALVIQPGDIVHISSLDASWGEVGERHLGIPRAFDPGDRATGHALTGPVYVEDAHPGDVLEVRIDEVRPGTWGWTWAGPRHEFQRAIGIEHEVGVSWRIDPVAGIATDLSDLGLTVPIRPFLGVMGNTPGAPGEHPTAPPRRVGGNLDCRELVAGSILWLPVEVEGALFSAGDGHAAQGDGEVAQTAIECPIEEAILGFEVRRGLNVEWPCAWTPGGFVTMGIGGTLDEAMIPALGAMLDFLQGNLGIDVFGPAVTGEKTHSLRPLSRAEALVLASVEVSLRVTQVVNGPVGIHALLPSDAIARLQVRERGR